MPYATFPSTFKRVALATIALLMLSWPGALRADEPAQVETDPAEFYQSLKLPLSDGKLQLSTLLGTLLDDVGLDGKMLAGFFDTSIDVTGTTGRLTMKTIAFATRDIITLTIENNGDNQAMVLRVNRLALRENRAKVQGRLMRIIEAWEPDAAAKLRSSMGFFIHQPKGKPMALGDGKLPENAGKIVILIHGLDEPGWCWDTMAPALVKEGFTVCEFRYPNDQAIAKSTKFFAEQLAVLRKAGAKDASILAHSMGALIARDVLTNAVYYGGKGDGGENFPTISRLIMFGPPNQGSALADLQLAGEIREQVVRLFTGDGHLFGAFFDGAGEAKEDLLPGSAFIKDLNARPLPSGVKMTIFASQMSPVNGGRIDAMQKKLRTKVPAEAAWGPDQIATVAKNLAEGLGDGAVSVASTKLEGVTDHVMVPGNHSSMLHKKDGESTAISQVLKRLKE